MDRNSLLQREEKCREDNLCSSLHQSSHQILELSLLPLDSFFPGYRFFFYFYFFFSVSQSRLPNEECVKNCGGSVDSSGCPLPAEYAEKLTHDPCSSGELVRVGLCL